MTTDAGDDSTNTTGVPVNTATTVSYQPEFTRTERERVPYRTIFATIGCVIGTYLAWQLLQDLSYILELIVISIFIALILNPAVDFLEYRMHMRRSLAASTVYIIGLAIFGALVYLFVQPLVDQARLLVDKLPQIVQDASNGEGRIGRFIQRHNIDQYVRDNQSRLSSALESSTGSILSIASLVANTLFSFITVLVLGFMMLLYGRQMVRAPLIFFRPEEQMRITSVASAAARTVTGYMVGNVVISVIAGSVTYITLTWLDVDFAFVLAVWVAICDLIPLVGATLGAIATVIVAALHSPSAGIITFVVYVVYQQVENHFIQPSVMARTVNLSPLVVLLSALIGATLAGFLGAMIAIPVAATIHVVGRDIFEHRARPFRGETSTSEVES